MSRWCTQPSRSNTCLSLTTVFTNTTDNRLHKPHLKYRQQVPTPGRGLEGLSCSSGPKRGPAEGPSTATTTPRSGCSTCPSSSVTVGGCEAVPGCTLAAGERVTMEPAGSWEASWVATAPMPAAGRQLLPVASMRMTNRKRREVTVRSRLKKMPPKKGRKKRSMISWLKPSVCGQRGYSVQCSVRWY